MKMKVIDASTQQENTTSFFVDIDGDIHDSFHEANGFSICVGEVIVDGFHVGSTNDMRLSALRKYREATK